jgi:hypothetical protein
MINPHKIIKAIKNTLKWLVVTHYGRLILAVILCVSGVFSEYGTIEFLTTDYQIFLYLVAAGIVIICGEFLWLMTGLIWHLTNKWRQ